MIFRNHKPERNMYRPGPPCPACTVPTTPHCLMRGCSLFECLRCGIWGGVNHVWHLRYAEPKVEP